MIRKRTPAQPPRLTAKQARDARGKLDGEKGGHVPYGYKRFVHVALTTNEEHAAIVRRIFRCKRSGASLQAIAAELNADGISTPKGGAKWYARTVKVILDHAPIYKGGKRGDSAERWPTILGR